MMGGYIALFKQLKEKFGDAEFSYDGASQPKVSFTCNGWKCIAELGRFSVKVTVLLGDVYRVNGTVPYVPAGLEMQDFMARMARLEKDACDKRKMLDRMAGL